MGFFNPSSSFLRREFRNLAARASNVTLQRPSGTKQCLTAIGLIGFTMTLIFILIPPLKEPVTVEDILTQQRLLGASNKFNKEIFKRLEWSKEYLKMVSAFEPQVTETYSKLLTNHLNSRRVVRIIRKENGIEAGKPATCKRVVPDCPRYPPNLRGPLPTKKWLFNVENGSIRGSEYNIRLHKGIWSPRHCTSRHSVAIIIPYRMRKKQLHILLHHLPAILKRQQINYSIFVIEQTGNSTFNKGILMNAGFLTALARPAHGVTFHCFIFHDVDLLSEDDRNVYTCPEQPRHMSVAVDELDYVLPYSELLGGVFAIRTDHFLRVNGYSNSYWGWGGEDDDMGLRIKFLFGQALRPDDSIGRYSSIQHPKLKPSLSLKIRRRLKRMTRVRFRADGLNTVKYKLIKIEEKYQYTHVHVDVGFPPPDRIYNTEARSGVYHMLWSKMKASEQSTHQTSEIILE